jgi:hypothetical protein
MNNAAQPSSGRQSGTTNACHHQSVTPAAINQPVNKRQPRKRERPNGYKTDGALCMVNFKEI